MTLLIFFYMTNNKRVIFEEKNHTYTCDGKKYKSVSHVFKTVQPHKDWDYIASRSALKMILGEDDYRDLLRKHKIKFDDINLIKILLPYTEQELFDETVKQLREEWRANGEVATTRGTAFHKKMELLDISNGYAINRYNNKKYTTQVFDKTYDNESLADNLYDLPDGYYPELLLFNHEKKMGGQADKVFIETVGNRRYIDIDDWKTDANILKRPDFRHPVEGYQMLEEPCSHMYDTNYSAYTIKISMYAWMIEQFGFEIRSLAFTSVDVDDDLVVLKEEWYPVSYKKWEVEQILKKLK